MKFGTELGVELSNAAETAYQHNGIIPSVSSVNAADNLAVNQTAAAGVSAWNLLALTGNTTLNGLAAAALLPDYLWRAATGNGIPLGHAAATLASNTLTLLDDLAVSGYGLVKSCRCFRVGAELPIVGGHTLSRKYWYGTAHNWKFF
jgi:hypothetical protein